MEFFPTKYGKKNEVGSPLFHMYFESYWIFFSNSFRPWILVNIGLGNDLVPRRWQVSTWTNADCQLENALENANKIHVLLVLFKPQCVQNVIDYFEVYVYI